MKKIVPAEDIASLLKQEEGIFFDYKAVEVSPASLSKSISAFANTSGGEIIVGVDEVADIQGKEHYWRGFPDQEAANPIFAIIEKLGGLNVCSTSFLESENEEGYLLHITIRKTQGIIKATNDLPYTRRNAQNLKVETTDALRRLELDKGIASFEDETVNVEVNEVSNSITALEFMLQQIPHSEPEVWLKSQFLLNNGSPTVASILLFADEPQAILPKRCAIKIFRYTTTDEGVDRERLAFDPLTVEGPIVDLISKAVAQTKEIVEGIKRMTEGGLEEISYPDETLHEIITNAVLHRDYSIATDTQIRIYDDRIEVQSPGRLAGHVTIETVLDEQFARNGKIVRMANKFPNPPNKDVGEGLNTAFEAMKKIRLAEPEITETENSVLVFIRHQRLASPAQIIMEYLDSHTEITNQIGREITGLRRDVQVKDEFVALRKRGLLEQVPGKRGRASAWRKPLPTKS
ncbi:putative DNA binding domain-containing protein [Leisingera daeponensis]|uniref:DNA binding domain-containing protein n=1 Tax=Leisingera daeponensis TaxID=405746 RepID=A0ABS7NIW3_9RHOB|nr:ATP-binding protein [Leisingera daeponensis]MBY6141149.1 putative DNA binding domain-containing protein [Leisingera daeponensis]